ncbi:MAG: endonuclease III [Acidaminococcales bacterium]|jgi:endonuclease-3|nr:endonuclease III [Acidaminococcales bacterium]
MDKRQKTIIGRLAKEYADARSALQYSNPFELLIATILSAQCTDKRVNVITARLFPRYGSPAAFADMPAAELEKLIRDCGLFHAKAKNIKAACRMLVDKFAGKVPGGMDDLVSLPGVGRKTANVVLSQAFGVPAIAVDTHVFRVSHRLGLAAGADAEKTERELQELLPRQSWSAAHHWLIWHGRLICRARNPLCGKCLLADLCRSEDKKEK